MPAAPRLGMAVLAVLGGAAPAAAHSPIKELGDFYGGLLHPVVVPAHALLLLVLGLLLWVHGPRAARAAVAAFLPLAALGLAAAWLAQAPAPPIGVLLALAVTAGLCVALAIPVSLALLALMAGSAGLMLGLDTVPEPATSPAGQSAFLLGALSGFAAMLLLVVALVLRLPARVRPLAVRVSGSWSTAIGLLSLSLGAAARASLP